MPHNALHRMIGQQADVLNRIAGLDLAGQAATLTAARRVILTGTGTSQHAAELGTLLLQQAGLDARWYPAATWARWSPGPQPGDALIVITHTGETAYAIRSRAAALAAGVPVLSITGTQVDWPEAIHTVPKEEAETYTVSYTAAVAVLARLAGQAGAADGSPEALRWAAGQVSDVLADPGIDGVPMPARSLVIVGPGPWGITAREGALKLREGARMLAEGFDTELFLHGNAVPFTAADGLLLLEPGADPDGLTAAVGVAAAAEGIPVATLAAPEDGLSPVLAQFPMTVRVQLLAERFAALRGTDPDTVITGQWADPGMWQLGSNS